MLQPGDSTNQRGSYVDQYAVNLIAGQSITMVARGMAVVQRPGMYPSTPDVMLNLVCNGKDCRPRR